MSNPRPGRPHNLLIDVAWFVPALAVFSLAAFVRHPAIAIALLVGDGLTMIAIAHAAHLRRRPVDIEPLVLGGTAYTALLTAYAAVFALVAFFPSRLILANPSFSAALLLSAAVFLLLLAPWRGWPAFGLAALLDELRARRRPPGLVETIGNSVELAHRMTAREDLYFPQGLVVSLALFALTLGAFAIAEIGVDLAETTRLIALVVYALVLAPLAHWLIVRASLAAVLDQRDLLRPSHRRDARPQRMPPSLDALTAATPSISIAVPASVAAPAPVPAPAPIDQAELDARLLRHARCCDGAAALAALAQGADANLVPDAGDRDQRSVVVLACVAQDLALLRALIGRGADINRAHAGLTPLIAATRDSYQGRPDVVVTLLTNGADPQCADTEGNTPLHFAVRAAEPTVAALLCDASAPIDAVNREGYTPLAIACALGRGDLVRFLIERRADVHVAGAVPALIAAAASPDDNTDVIKLLLKRGARIDVSDSHGRKPLAIAAQHDNADIVALLLKSGAAIDADDALGVTALMEAALAGAADALDVLGANAPMLEAADHTGRTALMFAAESMYADDAFVAHLLALGASPATTTAEGKRAVDFAAAAGRWSVVKLLDPDYALPASVDAGATTAAVAREDSPAHLLDALRFGHWQIADGFAETQRSWPMARRAQLFLDLAEHRDPAARAWLLCHGLDVNATLPNGSTLVGALLAQLPMSLAALREAFDAGAQTSGVGVLGPVFDAIARKPDARAGLEALALAMIERGADIFAADTNAQTPLAGSIACGSARIADALLLRGADPNLRDRHGRTPLFAAFALPAEAAEAVTRALVRAGADPELASANGETPLGLALASAQSSPRRWLDWTQWKLPKRALRATDLPAAAQLGDADAVAKLIDLGFAVDAPDAQGASALLRAAGAGHADIVVLLLERGADLAQATASGATPLSAAVTARRTSVVDLLLDRGIPVDQRLPGGSTVLMIAAALGYPDLVASLLARGADANAQDERGKRPLHAAAQFAFAGRDTTRARQTLEPLIGKGAELDARDAKGSTALHTLLGAHAAPGSVGDQQHLQALLSLFLVGRADVNVQDERGVSPLHACAMHGLILPARALLAARADPEATDSMGRTPRDVANVLGFIDVAAELTVRLPTAMPLPGRPAVQR